MPLNPPREVTKTEKTKQVVGVAQKRAESYLYRHAPVIAAFLAGSITGFVLGGW